MSHIVRHDRGPSIKRPASSTRMSSGRSRQGQHSRGRIATPNRFAEITQLRFRGRTFTRIAMAAARIDGK